jgi:magnesium chelatase family protein
MISIINSASIFGIDAIKITIEIDACPGLPKENIVGLPDTIIKESRLRIRTAIKNSGFKFPIKSYTINLAPADLQKNGAYFDLPIAVGILENTNQLKTPPNSLYIGELSLNGDIKPVKGILSICSMAKENGIQTIIMPDANKNEARLIKGIQIAPIKSLKDLKQPLIYLPEESTGTCFLKTPDVENNLDYSDVKGQVTAIRALTIAAAGHHNLLLIGSPGSGKTMLINRLNTILPNLSIPLAIESQKIRSISNSPKHTISLKRPFRAPHHSTSYAGMIGGGRMPIPGEITLAHNGILFLDELPEFKKDVLEVLRQPLEQKKITLSRAQYHIDLPANFMFAAAMNPCPCGFHGDKKTTCLCKPYQIEKYTKKISGPILDRIDIIIEVTRLSKNDLIPKIPENKNRSSAYLATLVERAQTRQKTRNGNHVLNGNLSPKQIKAHCKIAKKGENILMTALDQGLLTGRSYVKTIQLSRTIADLENSTHISEGHVLEAIQYRSTQCFK